MADLFRKAQMMQQQQQQQQTEHVYEPPSTTSQTPSDTGWIGCGMLKAPYFEKKSMVHILAILIIRFCIMSAWYTISGGSTAPIISRNTAQPWAGIEPAMPLGHTCQYIPGHGTSPVHSRQHQQLEEQRGKQQQQQERMQLQDKHRGRHPALTLLANYAGQHPVLILVANYISTSWDEK